MSSSQGTKGAKALGGSKSHKGEPRDRSPHPKLKPGPGRSAQEVASHQRARLRAALIELVSERGYNAVTVRDLVQRAGVSKRDYYKHFDGKEECFLTTYDVVVRRSVRGILEATAGETDWCERLQIGFLTLACQLEEHPQPARLALVEAFDAGPAALKRMQYTAGLFEALVAKSLSGATGGVQLPPLVMKGIVAGASRITRARLLNGRENELDLDAGELLDWTLSFCEEVATELVHLASGASTRGSAVINGDLPAESGERATILLAAARLAAAEGYHELTVPRIRAAAGVSKQSFHQHFEGASDCFLEAINLLGARALAEAMPKSTAPGDWPGAVHRTIAALCSRLARDPLLARLAFLEIFAPGSESVRWRGDLIATLGGLLRHGAEPGQCPPEFAAEASVGAIWGVIHHFVAVGRASRLPAAAPTLSYLALAPAIGGAAAYEAIAAEVTGSSSSVQRSAATK